MYIPYFSNSIIFFIYIFKILAKTNSKYLIPTVSTYVTLCIELHLVFLITKANNSELSYLQRLLFILRAQEAASLILLELYIWTHTKIKVSSLMFWLHLSKLAMDCCCIEFEFKHSFWHKIWHKCFIMNLFFFIGSKFLLTLIIIHVQSTNNFIWKISLWVCQWQTNL